MNSYKRRNKNIFYITMRIMYNGELLPKWVCITEFRKAAYLLKLKYISFEGGEWIESEGSTSKEVLMNAIR